MSEEQAPMVGTFSAPDENEPRLPRKEETPPEEKPPEESAAEAPKEDANVEITLSFEQRLKAVGLDIGEARAIMDTVLTKGYYEETIPFNAQKNVVLRTRTYTDTLRAQKFLELESPTYPIAINDLIARYNTAASLARFGDEDFNKPSKPDENPVGTESNFDRRYEFLMALPVVVVVRLMGMVHTFDMKMQAVFNEGAPEDF